VKSLIDTVNRNTSLGRPLSTAAIIVALFVLAWVLSWCGRWVASWLVDRGERRTRASGRDPARVLGMRQRETAISLASTTIRYVVFALAFVLSLATLAGAQRLETVAGASFLAIIIGFSAQRFLTDVIAGLLMVFEGWFVIGDTVAIDPLQARGVVEAITLRSLVLRSITGEIVFIPNSAVSVLRVIPRGYRQVEFAFFTNDLDKGRELVEQVARIVPAGTTRFVRRPELVDSERLDDDLFRITGQCAVAVGREWLAEELLPSLIKQRAGEGLLLLGPIITFSDEEALRSFSRAIFTGAGRPTSTRHRWLGLRRPRPSRSRSG
jgi:moderate conductance mechanosensitive channel